MEDLSARLRQVIKNKRLTAYEVSCQTGVNESVLSRILNGKTKKPQTSTLDVLANYLHVSSSWLLTGEGDMLRGGASESPAKATYGTGSPYYSVDFIAGFDIIFNNQASVPADYIYVPQYRNADCWVDVTGDSMSPLIEGGDMVALKKVHDWNNNLFGGEVYAIVTENWRTIKKVRIVRGDETKLLLVPLNPEYDSMQVSKESIVAVFQVLGAIKKIG